MSTDGRTQIYSPLRLTSRVNKSVITTMMLKIHCCSSAVLPIGTRMYFVKMKLNQLKLRVFLLIMTTWSSADFQNEGAVLEL